MYSNETLKRKLEQDSIEEWTQSQKVEALMACVRVFTVRDHDLHEIIHQKYVLKRTWHEIAENLNLSVGQVRYKHRIALHLIKKELNKEK